jgi:hypothetical protein
MDGSNGTSREVGRLQVSALAIEGQSIGALAIGHLVIGRANIKRLFEIGELVVGQPRVTESTKTP